MELSSKNKIYKASGLEKEGVSFKDWLHQEISTYNKKLEDGKITKQLPFDIWVVERWKGKLSANASADAKTSPKSAVSSIFEKTVTKLSAQPKTNEDEEIDKLSKKINKYPLGMNPFVFYTILVIAIGGVSFGVYRLIKNKTN